MTADAAGGAGTTATLLRLSWPAVVVAVLGAVLSGVLAARLVGSAGATGAVVGWLVALVGGQAGNVPVVVALPKGPRAHTSGILLGIMVRFVVTAGLLGALWALEPWPRTPLLLAGGFGQMAMLVVDVRGQVGLIKQHSAEGAAC